MANTYLLIVVKWLLPNGALAQHIATSKTAAINMAISLAEEGREQVRVEIKSTR